ncbi:MAG TPA: Hsp33 family molecular chaperone [Xanthobacteraceae bacterium]|nr:Hsp33 family molecular chaperone [Xanthobacteraceae bacterium]
MSAPAPRAPREQSDDDSVLPFAVEALDVRGRMARLGPALGELLAYHDYPRPVARLVAEAAILATLLATSLKAARRFILQTQTDGPVDMLVVDVTAPERLRAYARFDAGRVAEVANGKHDGGILLGRGHLAMTIDPGGDMNRYQGVVALEGEGLEAAAHGYFARSEQIPTVIRLAAGEEMRAGSRVPVWRAGGLLAQFLPRESARIVRADLDPGNAPAGTPRHAVAEDDAWVEARSLVATLEDHELIDPALSGERLLWRLFNERGVRVFRPMPVAAECSCSRARVKGMLGSFSAADRAGMVEKGRVTVKCEFCGRAYDFAPDEIGAETP